jgi:Ca2+:H+ antiporter
MSDSNPTRLAFNLTKFKSAARRESRKHPWNFPFFGNDNKPNRANTDLERGTPNREVDLRNISSAPDAPTRYEDGTYPSQNESTGSPTPNGSAGDDSTVRKRFGKTHSERENARSQREAEKGKKKSEEKLKFGFIRHVEPKEPYTVANQLRATLLNSWVNIFLLAVPAGFALAYSGAVDGKIVFAVNFVAIIPLAALLSYGTEEVALRTGETIGGLINATFGCV